MKMVKQEITKEVITALAAMAGTITTYHLLGIHTNTLYLFFKYLPYSFRPIFVLFSPGIIAAIIYGLCYRNSVKIIAIAIITIFLWVFWFSAIYPALTLGLITD